MPALAIVVGLAQLEAQATSLLAIIPVAVVGAWRQGRYGNLRLGPVCCSARWPPAARFAGVAIANAVPERALEIGFAGLTLAIAFQLARRALRPQDTE